MTTISALTLEADDTAATELFLKAIGVDHAVDVRPAAAASDGFRGFTLSLVVAQPGDADAILAAATAAGGRTVKPARKSFWGYGGVVQGPDGTLWKVACSAKKDSAPVRAGFDSLVLLLGVADVKATKQYYVDRGVGVAKSYGSKYVELETSGPVGLALYGRKALAKDAGVPVEGSGSHRLVLHGDLGEVTDPDGFIWAPAR